MSLPVDVSFNENYILNKQKGKIKISSLFLNIVHIKTMFIHLSII